MTVATMQYPRVLSNAHEIKRYPTFKAAQTIENAVFVVAYLMAALLGGMCGIAIAVYSGIRVQRINAIQFRNSPYRSSRSD